MSHVITKNCAILFCLISTFAGCKAFAPSPDIYVGPLDRFIVPSGWRISWPKGSKGSVLTPRDQAQRVSLEVWSDFSSWELPDERAAQQYLDYIHDTQDSNATLEIAGTVVNPQYGEHKVYRVEATSHTTANEAFLVFMSHRSKCVEIKLFSAEREHTDRFLPTLYAVARSFRFNEAR